MDDPNLFEEETIDIPINLTQASSLYLIMVEQVKVLTQTINGLNKELKNNNTKAVRDKINILTLVLSNAKWFKKELQEIIQELEPPEDTMIPRL